VRDNRIKLTELLFEHFCVPSLEISKNSILSSFAAGRSTSVVIDSGATATHVTPVHEGYALTRAMMTYAVGGEYITDRLAEELRPRVDLRPRYEAKKISDAKQEVEGHMETQTTYSSRYEDYPNTHPSFRQY
jgi:actin-related protein